MLKIIIYLDDTYIINQRRIYCINNLLVDLGGIMKSIISLLTAFSYPISWYLFTLKSIKRLFFAQTSEQKFFKHEKSLKINKIKLQNKSQIQQDKDIEINHRIIRLKDKDCLLLFLSQVFNKSCFFYWPKYKRMKKLFDEGNERVKSELNIVKILR